jgi:hypothetical protein
MSTPNISHLIQRLRSIRLQETEVLNAIEAELVAENNNTLTQRAPTTTSTSPGVTTPSPYVPGDRVIILNKINKKNKLRTFNSHTSTTPGHNQDRLATVVSIAGERVHLLTDTGLSTWRLPKNIARVASPR